MAPGLGLHTALIIDFDGTIAHVDVTHAIMESLARPGWRHRWDELVSRGVGSRVLQEQTIRFLPEDRDALLSFALIHQLDAGTRGLIEAARRAGWRVEVVSDGLGFYVRPMLERYGIIATVRSADLIVSHGGLRLATPWACRPHSTCTRHCATCKVDAVADLKAAALRVVLVGDGESDQLAAQDADVVYAKGALRSYCQDRGIAYRRWAQVGDVAADLTSRGELSGQVRR